MHKELGIHIDECIPLFPFSTAVGIVGAKCFHPNLCSIISIAIKNPPYFLPRLRSPQDQKKYVCAKWDGLTLPPLYPAT